MYVCVYVDACVCVSLHMTIYTHMHTHICLQTDLGAVAEEVGAERGEDARAHEEDKEGVAHGLDL